MDKRGQQLPEGRAAVDAFLARLDQAQAGRSGGTGRLIFVLDATMSRQPTWDRACHLQAEMFDAAAELGGLNLKLVYFRGRGECKASPWLTDSAVLERMMGTVRCRGGLTQIGRALDTVLKQELPPDAVVYVGDACEENPDGLCDRAARLGERGVPLFLFHEGGQHLAAMAFKEMARLSGGAYLPFSDASAAALKDLLRAVAVFATGGPKALEMQGGEGGRRLLTAMGRP